MTHLGHDSKKRFSIEELEKEQIYSSSDDDITQDFTVIGTTYKLERKKKLHQESTSKTNFNITAIALDFKGNQIF